MKKLILLSILLNIALADRTLPSDCVAYFNQNKNILDAKTRQADEARQELESFRAAFLSLQKQKMQALAQKEEELKKMQADVDEKLAKIREERKRLETKKDDVQTANMQKIGLTYSKMKPAAAATILEKMSEAEAMGILKVLDAKKISQILPKMDPEIAAHLSVKLTMEKEVSLIED